MKKVAKQFIGLFIACMVLISYSAKAWDATGHRLTAAIAYMELKQSNPKLAAKAVQILKQHPWFSVKEHWAGSLSGTAEDTAIQLFMLASTFPDEIKTEGSGFEMHKEWHYYDSAYVKPGDKVSAKPGPKPNTITVFPMLVAELGSNETADKKAIAICWILHLIGDIHQPLHSIELYTNDLPNGDAGGNFVCVKDSAKGEATNLHYLWDAALSGSKPSFKDIPAMAKKLMADFSNTDQKEMKKDKSIESWTKETYTLAVKYAYLDGKLQYAVKKDKQRCDEGPILPADYRANAYTVSKKRVVMAGMRIAECLHGNLK